MRINVAMLIAKANELHLSVATTRHDAETTFKSNAQIVLPPADVVRECADETEGIVAVDMEPGMALAAWRNEQGRSRITVIDPADEGDIDPETGLPVEEPVLYTLAGSENIQGDVERAQDGNMPLIADGGDNATLMFRLHSWLHSERAHDVLDADIRQRLVGTLYSFVTDVADRTGDPEWEKTSLMMHILDNYRDAPVPEGFDRYLEGKNLRNMIAAVDPHHEDAGVNVAPVSALLQARGVEASARAGSSIRVLNGRSVSDDELRAAVKSNDALCRHVFQPLTRTAIEDLAVGLLDQNEYERLVEALEESDEVLSGTWVDQVLGKLNEVVQTGVGNRYEYQTILASAAGRDILLVNEPGLGARYYYSWETGERRPLLEIDGQEGIPTISPEEIPDPQEIERLRAALDEIRPRAPEPAMEADEIQGP